MTHQSVTTSWRHAALVAAIVAALGITACGKKTPPATVGAPATGVTTAVAPAAPVDSDADLLTKAKTAENDKRLYAPAGNNAIEYYLALRQRNPNDNSAKNALTDLFPYAMIATEQNLKKGDEPGRVEAARIFALLERVDANAPSLPRLRATIQKEAADELKQQQDVAKKAQDDLIKKTAADKAAAEAKGQQPPAGTQPTTTPPSATAGPAATPTTAPGSAASPPPQAAQTQPTTQPAAATPPRPAPTQAATPAPTPPETPAPKPVRAAGGLPDVVSSVQPKYPRDALRDGVAGEVTVAFTVNTDGSVSSATIVTSNPRRVFDSAALEAIRKWRFEAPSEPVSGRRTFAFAPAGN